MSDGVAEGNVWLPSWVTSAYAQDTNEVVGAPGDLQVVGTVTAKVEIVEHPAFKLGVEVNNIDFSKIDFATKVRVPDSFKVLMAGHEDVWGFTTTNGLMFLKKDGAWYGYQPKKVVEPPPRAMPPPPQHQQRPPRGGFFKRY
jgi:hypothetical protein